jgi:hypothetical protein
MFPTKNGFKQRAAVPSLLFNFSSEYAINRIKINQDDLKLNCKPQLSVYANDVNILGGSVHAVTKNTETLVVVRKEVGIEVNADKTKYMVTYRDQNARRRHNKNIENSLFEMF